MKHCLARLLPALLIAIALGATGAWAAETPVASAPIPPIPPPVPAPSLPAPPKHAAPSHPKSPSAAVSTKEKQTARVVRRKRAETKLAATAAGGYWSPRPPQH